jgi:thiol-disulfide isomerase/thioredoxin
VGALSSHRSRLTARLRLIACVTVATLGTLGASADPLVFQDMDGRTHDADASLAEGRPVVLVFWQTWCPSCKREAPELVHAVEEYSDAMEFFGVVSGPDDVVDDAKVRRVVDEWGLRHPQIRDRDLTLTNRFEVVGTPVIIVLGQGARELFRGHRLPKDWSKFLKTPTRTTKTKP